MEVIMNETPNTQLLEIAKRIVEMREIDGITVEQMAAKTEVSVADYLAYESGQKDFPFSFIHKCALAFGIGNTAPIHAMTDCFGVSP